MKILCIDGGGIRGVFPAYICQKLEQKLGAPIYKLFDMVAGTSTGSIIAASVATGKSMKDILYLYKQDGHKVFKRHAIIALFQTFYSSIYFKKRLQKEFEDIKLTDVHIPLMIPAVDLTKGKAYVFRSYAGDSKKSSVDDSLQIATEKNDVFLWDAILASCAAPIYFPPNNIKNQFLAADGGLWANNPSLFSLTECMQHFKTPLEEVKILSLGTGEQQITYKIKSSKHSWGISKWLPFHFHPFRIKPTLLDFALHLTSESISEQCSILCADNYLRINTNLGEEVPFDELSMINHLIELADKEYIKIEEKLLRFIQS